MLKKLRERKFCNLPILTCVILFLVEFDMFQACEGSVIELADVFKYILITIELILFAIAIIPDFFKDFKFDRKRILFILLIILSGICTFFSHSRALFYTLLTCWLIRNEKLEDVFSFMYKSMAILVLMVIVVYIVSYICFDYNKGVVGKRDGKFRNALGFGHPNYLGIVVYNILLMFMCIKKDKLNWKNYLFVFGLLTLVDFVANSRTATLLGYGTLALFIANQFLKERIKKLLEILAKMLFPLCGILFFFIMFAFFREFNWVYSLNSLLSGRVYLACLALKTWGISIFGQYVSNLETTIAGHFIIETIYPYFLTYYGSIWLLIFPVLIPLSLKNSSDSIDYILLIIFSIYGLTEHAALNYVFVCSLLIFKNLFIDYKTNMQ